MAFLVGVILALLIGLFASFTGLDRDRAFYPTVMIVIALTYALFATIGGDLHVLAIESIFIIMFIVASIVGFKNSLWVVVLALFSHGAFDFVHLNIITNTGVPIWWPQFCLAYDVVAAGYLGLHLLSLKHRYPYFGQQR